MAGILDGIRVFDLTIAAVGPWASKLLGEMGADVIKVEAPEGELSHVIPPPIKGTAVLYISANFNKRHIVLDLKQEGDRATALKIIEKSDVFIQKRTDERAWNGPQKPRSPPHLWLSEERNRLNLVYFTSFRRA